MSLDKASDKTRNPGGLKSVQRGARRSDRSSLERQLAKGTSKLEKEAASYGGLPGGIGQRPVLRERHPV